MQIPLAHQRTYAFERYYYEFIERMGPAHLLYDQFVRTMENFGKAYFTVPCSYSGYPEELALEVVQSASVDPQLYRIANLDQRSLTVLIQQPVPYND